MVGCGMGNSSTDAISTVEDARSARTAEDSSTVAATTPDCGNVEIPKAKSVSLRAPSQTVKKGEGLTAVVRTSCGAFSIALDTKRFLTAVNSFVFLARKGFYDGIPFDYAGAGKYLHGGDPRGKAEDPGYTVPGRVPTGFIYRHGAVAMAEPDEAGYGRAGSQFFIVLAKPWLDFSGGYPPIGTVAKGFDVLNEISHLGPHSEYPSNVGVLGPVGKLRRPVVIENVSIEKG
jgi:cyclophilin family peptidyl-prolyl cis-trans isomerase